MARLLKFTPAVIVVIYIIIFSLFRHPGQPWDRIINSDGKGYYAYLPAVFIFHDLDYRFVEDYEAKYYPSDRIVFKEFRQKVDGKTVNKCFAGLAVAWLPFFLAAHGITVLTGLPADGYSIIYQYSIAIAALFYLWLGCALLFRLLRRFGATDREAAFITFITGLGTNLIFYTIIEGSMTHVYSFCFITIFLFTINELFTTSKVRYLFMSAVLFALIILIRPTNALILLLIPALIQYPASSIQHPVSLIPYPATRIPYLLASLATILAILSLQIIPWYFQTGHLLVYSYGNESFNFLKPHVWQILFSYNRGWFLYTPVAFVSLFGLIGMYRENRRMFAWVLAFLVLFIYGSSCWWMWYYASKCGQRIFIDIYAVIAIVLLFLFILVREKPKIRIGLISLLILLTGLNLIQFCQHAKWIFPGTYITKEIYWDSFFSLHPKARVYLPEQAITVKKTFFNDMEKDNGWINAGTMSPQKYFSGSRSSCVNAESPYSAGILEKLKPLVSSGNAIIQVSAQVFCEANLSRASLVFDIGTSGKSICYVPFYLSSYERPGRWTTIETATYLPVQIPDDAVVKIYFYNPEKGIMYIDDMKIEFLSLIDNPEYRNIDGVMKGCRAIDN
jgi:hypothetical protein